MIGARAAAAVTLLVGVVALVTKTGPSAPKALGANVDRIVASCTEDMVRQTCRLMNNSPNSASAAAGTVIFVAGIGAIDASIYNSLRASGDSMCQAVRQSCVADWNGSACKTARALFSSTVLSGS